MTRILKHIGAVLHTEDAEHVARAVRAIKERRLREVRVAFSEPGKVVQMRRRRA